MGYDLNTKAYRLYDPVKRTVSLARDVQFFEDVFPCALDQPERNPGELEIVTYPQDDSQHGGHSDDVLPSNPPPEDDYDDADDSVEAPGDPAASVDGPELPGSSVDAPDELLDPSDAPEFPDESASASKR